MLTTTSIIRRSKCTSPNGGNVVRLNRPISVMAMLGVASMLLGVSVPARAQTVDLVCTSAIQIFFTPPLNFNTVTASATGTNLGCTSPNGSHPELISNQGVSNGATATGCTPAPVTITGKAKLDWNVGPPSEFTYDVTTDPTHGGLKVSGTITSGTLVGDTVSIVPLVDTQNGACGLGGVTSLAFRFGVATFTR